MSRKLKIGAALLLLPALAFSAAPFSPAVAAPAEQGAGRTWNLLVGNAIFTEAGEKATWVDQRFFTDMVTVNVGDTVSWKFNAGDEPHTVTFLGPETTIQDFIVGPPIGPPGGPPEKIEANPRVFNPIGGVGAATYDGSTYINSGFISASVPLPKEYKVTFTKAGTYDYYCSVHAFLDPASGTIQGMKAKLVVQASGSAYPMTQAQVDTAAKAMMAEGEAIARTQEKQLLDAMETKKNADGTSTYSVGVGHTNLVPFLEYLRFWPSDVNIDIGDTVEWTSPTPGFHMVTFGEEIRLEIIEPQPAGPPKVFINLRVLLPSGPSAGAHTGTGFYNSGLLSTPETPDDPNSPFPVIRKYSLTFTQPGRFEYICPVHYDLGMDGFVNVSSGGGTPGGMPRTGGGSDLGIWLALSALGVLLAGAGVGLRARKVRA